MKRKIILFASFFGLLSACSQLSGSQPTPFPPNYLPTAVALTGRAMFATADALTAAVIPTETPLPTQTPIPPTALPTSTPTFEPGFTNFAQVRFLSPGPMSSLVSPINIQGLLGSRASNIVQMGLLG